jgi:hypothetical protein
MMRTGVYAFLDVKPGRGVTGGLVLRLSGSICRDYREEDPVFSMHRHGWAWPDQRRLERGKQSRGWSAFADHDAMHKKLVAN